MKPCKDTIPRLCRVPCHNKDIMPQTLEKLIQQMTAKEREEVTFFASFVIARRHSSAQHIFTDDIPTSEVVELAVKSGSFDWLDRVEEDGYSLEDGDSVQWPNGL
jgi:hypothetical protein